MVTLFEKVSFRGTPSISLSVFFGILLARQQDLQPPNPRQLRDTRPLTIHFFKVYFYNRVRCTPDGIWALQVHSESSQTSACHQLFKTKDFLCRGKQDTGTFIFQSSLTIQIMSGMENCPVGLRSADTRSKYSNCLMSQIGDCWSIRNLLFTKFIDYSSNQFLS